MTYPIVLSENMTIIDAIWFSPLTTNPNDHVGIVKIFDKHDGWLFFMGTCVSHGMNEEIDAITIAKNGASFYIKSLLDFFNIFKEVK